MLDICDGYTATAGTPSYDLEDLSFNLASNTETFYPGIIWLRHITTQGQTLLTTPSDIDTSLVITYSIVSLSGAGSP